MFDKAYFSGYGGFVLMRYWSSAAYNLNDAGAERIAGQHAQQPHAICRSLTFQT